MPSPSPLRVLLLGLVLCTAGCHARIAQQGLRKRATYELRCPDEQLTVTEIDRHTYGVDGCGRRAVYLGGGPSGVWRLDSLTDQSASAVAEPNAAPPTLPPASPALSAPPALTPSDPSLLRRAPDPAP